MKRLKIKRGYKDKFTVVLSYPNLGSFPHDGAFPTTHEYYRVDSEAELIEALSKEATFLVEDIEGIYYAGNDVSNNYLDFDEGGAFYRCKLSIRSSNNETNN
jgi:hypothetical protein